MVSTLYTYANTSCFCANCFKDGKHNFQSTCGWKKHLLKEFHSNTKEIDGNVDDWVAAVYDSQWFIGRVLGIDQENSTLEVDFLEVASSKSENHFKSPRGGDILWVPRKSLLAVIQPPVLCGTKRQKLFSVEKTTVEMILRLFQSFEDANTTSRSWGSLRYKNALPSESKKHVF